MDVDEAACGSDPLNAGSRSADNDSDNFPDCVDTIDALPEVIANLQLPKGTENSLLSQLDNLEAFKNHVRAQSGKKIPATEAAMLIQFADNILAK